MPGLWREWQGGASGVMRLHQKVSKVVRPFGSVRGGGHLEQRRGVLERGGEAVTLPE